MNDFDHRNRWPHRWRARRRVPPALARLLIVAAIVVAALVIAWVLTT